MPRKGRTGLEWLLEEESSKNGGNGSAGAAVENLAPVPEPKPDAELDAALALLDPGKPTGREVVSSPAPAALALTLGVSPASEPSREPTKRGLDAVANALIQKEKPKEEPKKDDDPPSAEMKAALDVAQEAVRVAAKAVDDGADHMADEIIARAKSSSGSGSDTDTDPEPATDPAADGVTKLDALHDESSLERSIEVSVAEGAPIPHDEPAKEPSKPSASPAPSAAEAAHKRAVSSGRSTRSHPRVVVPFEVKFRKGSESIATAGRNISVGGFFVESKKLLGEGEVFQAQLVFSASEARPNGNRKLSVIAEVMWSTTGDAENLDRFPPGMGCKFLDVDERDMPFLKELVAAALATAPAS